MQVVPSRLTSHAFAPAALVVAAIMGCSAGSARKPDIVLARLDVPAHTYVDPLPVGSYPSSKQRIQGWIDGGQNDSIRAHGWDIWQSITAAANDSEPTWQTWYSGHEMFDSVSFPSATSRPRRVRLPRERPRQLSHAFMIAAAAGRRRIPVDTFERVFAFNRFSRSTARFVWRSP